ncbi:MAG: hypothetical protein IPH60_15850 [Flavobacteriales bacterium]|nr:hypothetical protein [Flavobacteriales bacterium]
MSHQADKSLKTLLHMSALVSVREPGELRQYFERKRAEGKKPILVVNAVRNKLVHRVCADPEQQALRTATDNNDLNH